MQYIAQNQNLSFCIFRQYSLYKTIQIQIADIAFDITFKIFTYTMEREAAHFL
jgi:hypothetical protein